MKVFMAAALVAIGLAVLLLWRNPPITKGVYRLGFAVGLAAFAAIVLGPGGEWDMRIGRGPLALLAWVPITFVAMTPYLLLIESGIAGYRGFSSWVRYLSVGVAILGGVGLVAAVIVPRLLGR
jgi:hypothetical protein